jgi:predicted amidohydrolase
MRVAAIQFRPPKGRPHAARLALRVLLDEAGQRGADVIVCPEMATTGYVWSSPSELGPHSERAHGETFRMLSEVARQHEAWVVCGFPELFVHPERKSRSGRSVATLYNSALVVSPLGELVTCYRKILLYEADETWASPGWRRSVVPTRHGDVVPGICMDLNDPRFTRFLTEQQPRMVAFCTNWIEEGADVHEYWRDRLMGFGGAFVAANTWGLDGEVQFCGRSVIFGPNQEVLAEAPAEGDHVLVATLPD